MSDDVSADEEDTETCVGCGREVPYDDVEETTSGYMCRECIQKI